MAVHSRCYVGNQMQIAVYELSQSIIVVHRSRAAPATYKERSLRKTEVNLGVNNQQMDVFLSAPIDFKPFSFFHSSASL